MLPLSDVWPGWWSCDKMLPLLIVWPSRWSCLWWDVTTVKSVTTVRDPVIRCYHCWLCGQVGDPVIFVIEVRSIVSMPGAGNQHLQQMDKLGQLQSLKNYCCIMKLTTLSEVEGVLVTNNCKSRRYLRLHSGHHRDLARRNNFITYRWYAVWRVHHLYRSFLKLSVFIHFKDKRPCASISDKDFII